MIEAAAACELVSAPDVQRDAATPFRQCPVPGAGAWLTALPDLVDTNLPSHLFPGGLLTIRKRRVPSLLHNLVDQLARLVAVSSRLSAVPSTPTQRGTSWRGCCVRKIMCRTPLDSPGLGEVAVGTMERLCLKLLGPLVPAIGWEGPTVGRGGVVVVVQTFKNSPCLSRVEPTCNELWSQLTDN